MARFTGRTAVVTGGTSGIGAAVAATLGAEGARVFVAGRDHQRGAAIAADVTARGGVGHFIATDVSVDAEVARLAEAAGRDSFIDFWFSNAGVEGPIGGFDTWEDTAVAELLDVNVKAVLSGLRHAAAHMREGGVIVNTASFVGTVVPVPIAVPYAASKAAVVAAGRSVAPLLTDMGVKVVTLCPWVIDTPMVVRLAGDDRAERQAFAAQFAPSGLLTPVDDVARAAIAVLEGTISTDSGAAYLVDAGPTVTPLP